MPPPGEEAPLAVRIRHRDRRTGGGGTTLSLQGPHGGDTANTILNNPVGRAEGHGVRDGSGAPLAPSRALPPQDKELELSLAVMFPAGPRAGMGGVLGNWNGRTDTLLEGLRRSRAREKLRGDWVEGSKSPC